MIAAQIGGRILDKRGARPSVVIGGALGAVGFFLLAGKLTDLSLGAQWLYIAIAGAGLGLMLGPASTDAVNRAPSTSYSEVTGITQTARNFGASLGLAVLGAILISRNDTNVTGALTKHGVPSGVAHRVAASFGAAARRPAPAPDDRRRWCTTSSSRSRTRRRPSSTSWPASWRRRSSSRSAGSHAADSSTVDGDEARSTRSGGAAGRRSGERRDARHQAESAAR